MPTRAVGTFYAEDVENVIQIEASAGPVKVVIYAMASTKA
jgi:hypothetical protein